MYIRLIADSCLVGAAHPVTLNRTKHHLKEGLQSHSINYSHQKDLIFSFSIFHRGEEVMMMHFGLSVLLTFTAICC